MQTFTKQSESALLRKTSTRLLLLFTIMLAINHTVFSQANYWGLYNGEGTNCNDNQKINTNNNGTLGSLPSIGMGGGYPNMVTNTAFDANGHLLFSVNGDAIYDQNGSLLFDQNGNYITFDHGVQDDLPYTINGVTYYTSASGAVSEISIFPVSPNCNRYYVMLWSAVQDGTYGNTSSIRTNFLRLIEVDITGDPTSTSIPDITFVSDNIIYANVIVDLNGYCGIVADKMNADGSRDVYTEDPYISTTDGNEYNYLRKFHFLSDGTQTSTLLNSSEPASSSMEFKMCNNGITYISGNAGASDLICIDKTTLNVNVINEYTESINHDQIHGFEYIPKLSSWIISYYNNDETGPASGLKIVNSSGITLLPGTEEFEQTNIEFGKDGYLYLLGLYDYADDPSHGQLYYINPDNISDLSNITPAMATCSGSSNNIYSDSYSYVFGSFSGGFTSFYLTKQIAGEDYNYGMTLPSGYTVGSGGNNNEIWTPTSNPYTSITGNASESTIRIGGNLVIPAGTTLTIENMTVEMAAGTSVIVQNTTGSGNGGKLNIDNTTLTAYQECGSQNLWQGVVVQGSESEPQGNGVNSKQGTFIMSNNSVISYANIGAQSGSPYGIVPVSGGGIITANSSTFYNNVEAVLFANYIPNVNTYSNGPFGGALTGATPPTNPSGLIDCNFTNDNTIWFGSSFYQFVMALGVEGINIKGCNFTNNTGDQSQAMGVVAGDAGVSIGCTSLLLGYANQPSTFTNLNTGVYGISTSGTNTLAVHNSNFTGNNIGITISGVPAASLTYNTFNIPSYTGAVAYTSQDVLVVNDQNIGILIKSSSGYTINSNVFNTDPGHSIVNQFGHNNLYSVYSYSPYTTGVLAWNTGSDNNLIKANTYNHTGVGNLSNYINTNANSYFPAGLQFLCSTHNYNGDDEAIVGNHYQTNGININQGSAAGPAGNSFSQGIAVQWNIYNPSTEVNPMTYYYYAYDATQNPGNNNGVYKASVTSLPQCNVPGDGPVIGPLVPGNLVAPGNIGSGILPRSADSYDTVVNNVQYYMTDTNGMLHRDSLYYWAAQMGTAYGDLLVANLLMEDSLIDSAKSVYGYITTKYALDSVESTEFNVWGQDVMDVMAAQRAKGITQTLPADAKYIRVMEDVAANAQMWAKIRAEGWLQLYNGEQFTDTLLYPGNLGYDSNYAPKGVLAVTELSKGATKGCEYAEMVVVNCDTGTSDYVDVRGWIMDDNSGEFNSDNACALNAGISQGHYRLSYDNTWSHVPIGSVIIIYNDATNCYSLTDTFEVDTVSYGRYKYWLPVNDTAPTPHLERFAMYPDSCNSTYTNDSTGDSSAVITGTGWSKTINLSDTSDGFQVRCPQCSYSPDNSWFYQGICYGDTTDVDSLSSVPADTTCLGAPLIGGWGAGYKYVFNGYTKGDFGDKTKWSKMQADPAGSSPYTLGVIDDQLADSILRHTLDLPCCTDVHNHYGSSHAGSPNKGTSPGLSMNGEVIAPAINVYPNPADDKVEIVTSPATVGIVVISDVVGKEVVRQTLQNGQATISVNGLAPGVYLYEITNGEMVIRKGKFVKE